MAIDTHRPGLIATVEDTAELEVCQRDIIAGQA